MRRIKRGTVVTRVRNVSSLDKALGMFTYLVQSVRKGRAKVVRKDAPIGVSSLVYSVKYLQGGDFRNYHPSTDK